MKKDWVVSTPAQRDHVAGLIEKFKLDRVIKITVEHWNATRTKDQNARYWKVIVTPAADFSGCSALELHEDLLCERFGCIERRLPSGHIERTANRRSSDLNKTEFSEYMDWAEGFLAEKLGMTFA